MRAAVLTILVSAMASPVFAQEGENAPLELGRPSAKPIEIERPSLMPPPTETPSATPGATQKPRVKKRRVKPGTAAAPTTVTPPPATTTAAPNATPTTAPTPTPTTTTTAAPTAAPTPSPTPVAPATPTRPRRGPPAANETVAKDDGFGFAAPKTGNRHMSLLNFRLANIWAVRNRTNTGSFIASWDPVLIPYKRWNFGATLGVTQFESENVAGRSAESFLVYEYGATASYYMSRTFLPELVIGAQMWDESGSASNNIMVAFNGNVLFRKRSFGFLDRFYVGFGSLRMDGGSTNLFRAGLGARF